MECNLCSEDVSSMSPCSGKRCREETIDTADEIVLSSDVDVGKETAPRGNEQNGREEKAASGDIQAGKRIKADCDRQHEKDAENTSKRVQNLSDDLGGAPGSEQASDLDLSKKTNGGVQLEEDAENFQNVKNLPDHFVGTPPHQYAPEHASEVQANENAQFHCTFCSVHCTSEKDYKTHLAGKRHAKALTGIVTTQSSKVKTLGAGSKTKISMPPETVVLNEDSIMEEKVPVDGSITGNGHLLSCLGGRELQAADLQALGSSVTDDGKDVIMDQPNFREGANMETLGEETLKYESTSKLAQHDGKGNFQDSLANSSMCKMSADQLANCNIMDAASYNKSNAECVAQALAIAYEACACPGLEGLSKSGVLVPCRGSVSTGAASSTTSGMVSMHAHCFMNLLRDVQVKSIEDLFQRVASREKAKCFKLEASLPSCATTFAIPPSEKDLSCSLCCVEYGSNSDLELHMTGKKHTSLVRRMHLKCQVCNVHSNSEKDWETHMSGRKHASKVRLIQKRVAFQQN